MRNILLLIAYSLFLLGCLNNSSNQENSYNKDSAFDVTLDSISKVQESQLPTDKQVDSIKKDENIDVWLGKFKATKGLVKYYEHYNTINFLSINEMKNYSKNGIIKKDLYILKAGFDYDQNFQTQFRVKFINLTDETIGSVQIGDIDIETRYPFTNKYFKEHIFNVPGCMIKPGETKFVTFFPNKEAVEKNIMQYQQGIGAIIYNLDYVKENGEHVTANRNISTNLKWTIKNGN